MKKAYRVGIIGSTGRGDYGHGLDTCWLEMPEATIVGVADDDPKGLSAAAARLKVKATYADYRRMLDEVKPDLVAIAPRWINRHAEMAVESLRRGIHVYMEKPLCRTLEEADEIIRAGEMTHARLALAHTTRYSPKLARVRELIESGMIGEILEIRGRGKEDSRGGGEDFWVLGSHVLNLIVSLAGPAEWCFATILEKGKRISAANVKEGNEGIGPLAGDDVRATWGLKKGMTATFQSKRGTAGSPSRFGVQIFGTKGIIELATGYLPTAKLLVDSSWSPSRGGSVWKDISSEGVEKPEPLASAPASAGNIAAIHDLIGAIEENREPLCSARDGRAVIEMILAAFESERSGAPVQFPAKIDGNPMRQLT
jgi:predicted dehydrogenase